MNDPYARSRCHRCGRGLAVNAGRPVPLPFKILAALSMAAAHGGTFVMEELSNDYCGPCRRWLSFMAILLAMLVTGIGIGALWWAVKQGFIGTAWRFWTSLLR